MRDYKKEYQNYQGRPEQIKNRTARNRARRLMIKKHGKSKLRGKDVDHKDSNPRNNGYSNLRIMSKSKNRARLHD